MLKSDDCWVGLSKARFTPGTATVALLATRMTRPLEGVPSALMPKSIQYPGVMTFKLLCGDSS